jgi:Tol biopolymer transport system component
MHNKDNRQKRFVNFSRKTMPGFILLILIPVLGLILSLIFLPAAKAEDEVFVHIPVLLSPPIPGSTGVLAYTVNSGTDREIYTINADGSNMQRLTNNDAVDDMPAWSADGTALAFTSDLREKDYFEIYTMNADGSEIQRLTDSQWDDNSPSFSPDGGKIVFASDRSGIFQIFVMNSDGSEQTPLTEDSYISGQPEWSPDGTKIVYSSNQDSGFALDIYVMDSDGSDKTRITSADGHDFAPAWSPDGKQVVFTSTRDSTNNNEVRRIYVMDADGSNQNKLATFYSDWPDWSPDGTRIVFTRHEGGGTAVSGGRADLAPEAARRILAHNTDAEEIDRNLYTINPDGTNLQPFTQTPTVSEDRPNWGP